MSSITIRKLDPAVKERLRVRAAEHGHSKEAEARSILQSVLGVSPANLLPKRTGADLVARIRARFEPLGVSNWNCRRGTPFASRKGSIDVSARYQRAVGLDASNATGAGVWNRKRR